MNGISPLQPRQQSFLHHVPQKQAATSTTQHQQQALLSASHPRSMAHHDLAAPPLGPSHQTNNIQMNQQLFQGQVLQSLNGQSAGQHQQQDLLTRLMMSKDEVIVPGAMSMGMPQPPGNGAGQQHSMTHHSEQQALIQQLKASLSEDMARKEPQSTSYQ